MSELVINNKKYRIPSAMDIYIRVCASGVIAGSVIGGAIGCTFAALSPFIICAGIYKIARRHL
jgi:hypothetical protein